MTRRKIYSPPWPALAAVVAFVFAPIACAVEEEGRALETGDGLTTLDPDDDGEEEDGDDGDPLFDVGDEETGGNTGGDAETGCEKVDLLFVVDNSGSMEDEQESLGASVPGFIDEIRSQLADTDSYHIGVVTSDTYAFNSPGCLGEGNLVTKTGGEGSSDSACGPFEDGYNFMTEADDLDWAFTCAIQVGIGGDGDERPIQTMGTALSSSLGQPGQCNEGFLREDALLVVVIITDEEDDHETASCLPANFGSTGEPQSWFNAVVQAKGVQQHVALLSLVGPTGPEPAPCPALDKCDGGIIGAEPAPRIVEFTEMFTHGFVGRVCEPSYTEFFADAVGVVKSACDDFVPPG
jgi:hypothetical protein